MNGTGEPAREIQALRQRVRALSTAILRICARLNVATVLQEAADSAGALTVVRCGVITAISETGEVRDFVSSGFTGEEHCRFREWPDGRGVLLLVNGTPIRDEDGRVVSVVAAMQDLAPCQLLERQRAVHIQDAIDRLPALQGSPDAGLDDRPAGSGRLGRAVDHGGPVSGGPSGKCLAEPQESPHTYTMYIIVALMHCFSYAVHTICCRFLSVIACSHPTGHRPC